MRGLVIENTVSLRRLFKSILQTELPSMTIIEAADGPEAFLMAQRDRPDIILMDAHLNGEKGFELSRKIKDKFPDTVLIVLDVHGIPEYREAAASSGADYFLDISSMIRHKVSPLIRSILLEKGVACPETSD